MKMMSNNETMISKLIPQEEQDYRLILLLRQVMIYGGEVIVMPHGKQERAFTYEKKPCRKPPSK